MINFLKKATLALLLTVTAYADNAEDKATAEALAGLTTAPTVYESDFSTGQSTETVTSLSPGDHKTIFFDSEDYEGNPTRVHAWVSIPATASATNKVPAVVLVHGGGGRAFETWAQLWADRGYAAISIDTEGNSESSTDIRLRHTYSGPSRVGVYGDSTLPIKDQFMYHAVAGTTLANSLLRSLDFVDADHVGVHGVSWGGVITATVIGIDTRFDFAIPSYGSGHMWDAIDNWQRVIRDVTYYREVWDPMSRLHKAQMPIQWLSWPTDGTFNIDCQANSYNASPGTDMVTLIPGMGHGHGATWLRADPYEFANSVVQDGKGWCQQQSISRVGNAAAVTFESTRALSAATLIYSQEQGSTTNMTWFEVAVDSFAETSPGIWSITATLPEGVTGWYVHVAATALITGQSARGDTIFSSSRLQEIVTIDTPETVNFDVREDSSSLDEKNVTINFTALNNLEVTNIEIINETHTGAFTTDTPTTLPLSLNWERDSELAVTFNNGIAALANTEVSTATLRISWVELDNVTINAIDIPLLATGRESLDIIYDVDELVSTQGLIFANNVSVINNTTVTFQSDGGELIPAGNLSVEAGSTLHILDGLIDNTEFSSITIDGDIEIDGGTLALNGADINGNGSITIQSGELNLSAGSSYDLNTLNIHGGVINFNTSSNNSQLFFGDNTTSTMNIYGSNAQILFSRLNLQPHTATAAIFNYQLDDAGVSPVINTSFTNLPQLTANVDAGSYSGETGTLVLISSSNLATASDLTKHTTTGFAEMGLTATFQEANNNLELVLSQNDYGDWIQTQALSPDSDNAGQDSDNDGLPNLIEYALGTDPNSPTILPSLIQNITDPVNVFEYTRDITAAENTEQTLQYSTDLVIWENLLIEESNTDITISPVDGENERVSISLTPDDSQRFFTRLEVTIQ